MLSAYNVSEVNHAHGYSPVFSITWH